jgi:subtilase family protein
MRERTMKCKWNYCKRVCASLVLTLTSTYIFAQSATPYESIRIPPETLSLPPTFADTAALDPIDAKIHAQLRSLLNAQARGIGIADTSGLPAALRRGDQVLVEVRLDSDEVSDPALSIFTNHGATIRNSMSANLHEVWIPSNRLRELAAESSVTHITPARVARHVAGSKTSEGVAAGNADYWQTFNPAYTGTGVTIAMIDGYDKTKVASLQTSGDWPPTARLSCFDLENIATNPPYAASSCTASGFGSQGDPHGNATMEIAYDVAPGATYRAYDTVTVGDWYSAIRDAANVNAVGGSLGAVKANVISASLAAPLDGIGDGTAIPGSIAEAAGFARNRGLLVVNAAGNERENHWGGLFQLASGGSGFHTWSGSNTLYNFFGMGNSAYCIPSGTAILVQMYWNNWLKSGTHYVANHDYGLYLYQNVGSAGTPNWVSVAFSDFSQNGGVDQTPQEFIQYTTTTGITTGGCSTNTSVYAVVVVRNAGTTANDNLQVFADAENSTASYPLNYQVTARSLDFPADSPNVFSIAAIDVANASNNPQEPFSSEGPVLASGGGIPTTIAATDPNLKPNVASFDHVTTVTYGASSFYGTSAATPHAGGMAALFMQRFGIQTTAANLTSKIVSPLQTISATGKNDLGPTGKDYQYGFGRLRFQKDASVAFIQQPSNTLVNTSIAPAITVGIYDSESKLVPYTLFDALTLAIANDPNGGSAVLSGGGSANLVAGTATYSAVKINLGGTGYTLKATASAATVPPISLTATSNAFNITTGTASKLAFTVQPVSVTAGVAMSPAIKVSVEDSSGNVINSNNTTMITLTRTSCSGVVPVGGGPITVTNGVATFSGLTLNTVATNATLIATASGLSQATSSSFAVVANPSYIFKNGFETCTP